MRWMLLIAALATTGCKTAEIVVAHPESGITVTTRFTADDEAPAMSHVAQSK